MPIETILELLENGKWHRLKEIEKETHLNSGKVERVTKFLASHNFVKLNEVEQKVKISSPTNSFLKKIRQLEQEENK